MPNNIEIKVPYPQNSGNSPNPSAMSRAQGFATNGSQPSKPRRSSQGGTPPPPSTPNPPAPPTGGAPGQSPMSQPGQFPLGLNPANMLGFARTPAGQQMIAGIMAKLQAGRMGPTNQR